RQSLGLRALAEAAGHDDPQHARDRIEVMPAVRKGHLFNASIRDHLGTSTASQRKFVQETIERLGIGKATGEMATSTSPFYTVDTSNLGSDFDAAGFVQAVTSAIAGLGFGPVDSSNILVEGITGMLLLDGNSDPQAPSFGDQITNRLWNYIQAPLVDF